MAEKDLEKDIQERLELLRSGKARSYFLGHLDYPSGVRGSNEATIREMINPLQETMPSIRDLIKEVKKNIKSIDEQTKFSAVYLLLGKVFSNIEAMFILAGSGKNLEMMEMCRSAQESLDLIILFLIDESDPLLKRWFAGATIPNKEARAAIHKFLNEDKELVGEEGIPVDKMTAHIYDIYSKYTHSSYAALLDAVDAFHEDFDFEGYSGFHYTKENFRMVQNISASLATTLKHVFLNLKDQSNFERADKIYKTINPSTTSREEMAKIIERYKGGKS